MRLAVQTINSGGCMLLNDAVETLKSHKQDLSQYGVYGLAIFGSVARNESSPQSDVDILIDFEPQRGLFGFIKVKNYLEDVLKCEVDLVMREALHPALKTRILREAKHVF